MSIRSISKVYTMKRFTAIFLVPKNKSQLPIVIDYLGYMNHLQEPFQFAHWALIDCACLVIDNRGQGGRTKRYTSL